MNGLGVKRFVLDFDAAASRHTQELHPQTSNPSADGSHTDSRPAGGSAKPPSHFPSHRRAFPMRRRCFPSRRSPNPRHKSEPPFQRSGHSERRSAVSQHGSGHPAQWSAFSFQRSGNPWHRSALPFHRSGGPNHRSPLLKQWSGRPALRSKHLKTSYFRKNTGFFAVFGETTACQVAPPSSAAGCGGVSPPAGDAHRDGCATAHRPPPTVNRQPPASNL